jgi:hypothetical protein
MQLDRSHGKQDDTKVAGRALQNHQDDSRMSSTWETRVKRVFLHDQA